MAPPIPPSIPLALLSTSQKSCRTSVPAQAATLLLLLLLLLLLPPFLLPLPLPLLLALIAQTSEKGDQYQIGKEGAMMYQ